MKKSIQSMVLTLMYLSTLLSGCISAITPIPPTVTPVPFTPTIVPTDTPAPTATAVITKGKITGHVFQSDTNRSFSDATVTLNNASLDPKDPSYTVATTVTDADGIYVFDDVLPGKYTLTLIVWIEEPINMPCSIMLMQGTTDQKWLMVTIQQNTTGKQGILANQSHIENNTWVPTIFDVAVGDLVRMDADLRCQ